MLSMPKAKVKLFIAIAALLLISIAVWLAYTRFTEHQSQLSVKPPSQFSNITLEPIESTLGLQAIIPFETIQKAAEQATDQPQTGGGEKQTCKRILGAKACATAQWQYHVTRSGEVGIAKTGESVRISIPLALSGTIGLDGRGAKIFGLRNKQINGELELSAELRTNINADWCPTIQAKLQYRWISDPKIRLVGKIKINIRKSADKALQRSLQKVEKKLTSIIDCVQFRAKVAENWKVHHIPLKIPGHEKSYLELTPGSVATSNAITKDDHVSLNLELHATTEIVDDKSNSTPLILPNLTTHITQPGAVEFSLLINLPYSQIKELVSQKLIGEVQQSEGKRFLISSFDLYPSNERLIFELGFTATGYGRFLKTSGTLYLSARPIADYNSNELRLEDLQFTRIIDSDLWSVLSTVLHNKILESLDDAAIINLEPQMRKLELSIINALADPNKTGGIVVSASTPEVRLVTVNPEAQSLAAIIHVSTSLDATIPPKVLLKK